MGGVAALKAGAVPAALPVYLQEPTAWGTRAWDDATPGRHVAAAVAAKRAGAATWTFHQRVGYALTTESWRARLDRAGALRAELEAVGPAVAVEGWGVAMVADEVTYYHLDALGSVRAVSDETGQVVARHDYRPFGEEVAPEAGVDPRRFTGKERDAESGLDYFGARYYRAGVGRFTTIDPVYTWQETLADPQRWNRYAYVRNNPLRYVDPDGKVPILAIAAIAWGAYEIGSQIYDAYTAYKTVTDSKATGPEKLAAVGGFAIGAIAPGGGYGTAAKTAVYASRGAGDVVQYVGITNNVIRRAAEHAGGKRFTIGALKGLERLSRADARAVEQALIEIHKLGKDGGTLLNKINSIAKTNEKYADALRRGYDLLKEAGYAVK